MFLADLVNSDEDLLIVLGIVVAVLLIIYLIKRVF